MNPEYLPTEKTSLLNKYSPKTMATFLGAILLFAMIIFYSLSQFSASDNDTDETAQIDDKEIVNLAANTIVYGTWNNKESLILAYDLSTGQEGVLAKLPSNVKKISVLSEDTLIYIKDTDVRDYGREIAKFTVSTGISDTLFQADEGFGIDDYVLSPNKEYIAIWEVKPNSDTGVLENGNSRVYTARPSTPNQKNLIFDELSQNTPVHYPLAILDTGTVFMDRFLPNSGAGWAYGMSVSNFNGTERQTLSNMLNGSYGTQPVLSPNGEYLAFAGYTSTDSSSSGTLENRGFRQAILTPNTVEIMDTTTFQRQIINTDIPNAMYNSIKWDDNGQNLYYTAVSDNLDTNGDYAYSLAGNIVTKKTDSDELLVDALNSTMVLVAEETQTTEPLGNLGDTYRSAVTQLSVRNTTTGKKVSLPLSSNMTQVIATVPNNYFTHISPIESSSGNKLQIGTFTAKPTLEPKREEQQSTQKPATETEIPTCTSRGSQDCFCRNLATQQCNALLGMNLPNPRKLSTYNSTSNSGSVEFTKCYVKQVSENRGKCSDSPLYLYGPEGTDLTVTVHTQLFNSSAPYKNGYHVTLTKDGKFKIDNKEYASIDFDYIPALRRIIPPTYGDVVAHSQLEKTIRAYAEKLGLNKKETFDLVQYAKTEVTGDYIFLSFFDHETSHAMLPMTFNIKPDTYRNIVFYFKSVSAPYSLPKPQFDKIERGNVTVIEVSGIVE
jgi:hypothetical protein